MTNTADAFAPNQGPATTNPLPPAPPPAADLGGPISEQPTSTISTQELPSGDTGAQEQAAAVGGQAAEAAATQQQVASSTPAAAANATQATTGVSSALSQTIATAISLGLAQTPTTAAGWAQLADYYSTTAGENQVTVAQQNQGTTPPGTGQNAQSNQPTQPTGGGPGMGTFLAAIRQHESGGNYTADSGDGAYGAYQFIPSTWNSEATAAGYGKYANGRADQAPPQVQDAVANFMATGYYKAYNGDFNMMARAWYDPAYVNQPNYAPPGNNGLTIGQYGDDIVGLMNQDSSAPAAGVGSSAPHGTNTAAQGTVVPTVGPSTNTVVSLAQSQLGVPYQWGGESQGQDFDCSGLVQWAYGKEGVQLPRTAQAQYDATAKVGSTSNLQPGDLLFFGGGPGNVTHVGIYIGNGQMIDAPHTGADVRVDQVFGPNGQTLWAGYVGATRPGDPSGASTTNPGTTAASGVQQSQQQYGQILQNVTNQLAQLQGTYPGIFDTTQAVMP